MYERIYKEAAKILDKLLKNTSSKDQMSASAPSASMNNLVMSSAVQDKRKLTAVICHVLEYREILDRVLNSSDIMKVEKKVSKSLLLVLLHDFLIGGGLKCGGLFKAMIMRHKVRLNAEFIKCKVRMKVRNVDDLKSDSTKQFLDMASRIPRHVRVNTNKITVKEAIKHFSAQGYQFMNEQIEPCGDKRKVFQQDKDLKELLVFPRGTDFHLDGLYKNGSIILQEKSSCFPALALSPSKGSQVIDACAAPGNKTTHLSALMRNSGTIFAFDKDKVRLNRLKTSAQLSGCVNILAECKDFLSINPTDSKYSKIEYVLLDPSCSGSGIVSRMDSLLTNAAEQEHDTQLDTRLKQLADFQLSVILHAMKFPMVKRIVYSTCSLHEEENEQVVIRALRHAAGAYKVVKCLDFWKHRGKNVSVVDEITSEDYENMAECVVRCSPQDNTNGFFVACFEKVR